MKINKRPVALTRQVLPLSDSHERSVPDRIGSRNGSSNGEKWPNEYLSRLARFTPSLLKSTNYSLVSLFCGGGGLDLGLGFAGFRTLVASDVAPVFVDSVVSNIPTARPCKEDAFHLTKEMLCNLAGTNRIDLVAAGPPCQAFSILGRRGALADPRGKLTFKYFDLVAEIQPRAFIFENVPGLLTLNKGEEWQQLLEYAKAKTGYQLYWRQLNALTFGIPQVRERIFLVGLREESYFQFPSQPTGPRSRKLMDSMIGFGGKGLPSAWALQSIDGLPNHNIRQHGARVRRRYRQILPGQRDRTDHTDRIDPDRPSGTVLVGSAAGGGRPHIHPYEDRVITVREGARLQSFPDWYVFQGGSTSQYRQIGNAVPPLLAYEVGKAVAHVL